MQSARELFARNAWAGAYEAFSTAQRAGQLDAEDLERLATAAYLSGHDAESTESWARAHQSFLYTGNVERAVRCAFWLAFGLLDKGEHARAGGWLARARRLLENEAHDCVEHGYLLIPVAVRSIFAGDNETSYASFSRAVEIAERFGDADLATLARHGQGRALIRLGRVREGVALLDEAMATVEAGVISPLVAGDVYCSVIEACHEILDLRRAQEWTAALTHFCESQPDLVPYRGQCLIRRAEILQLHGAWQDAMQEAVRACERLSQPPHPAVGAALYQCAELHRLRGEFAAAEAAYREASKRTRKPLPGPALLRLAQGDKRAALDAIRPLVDNARDTVTRSKILAAYVEIALANGEVAAARQAADDLAQIADQVGAPVLHAVAAQAQGAVLLALGEAQQALEIVRHAYDGWQALDAPYELARTRVLVAMAARALNDSELETLELDAARPVFLELGAAPDLRDLDALRHTATQTYPDGLSPREVEVLRLLASGKTNRAIAAALYISDKTVARHVSNIFTKLRVSTRAAATAYAFRHDLA